MAFLHYIALRSNCGQDLFQPFRIVRRCMYFVFLHLLCHRSVIYFTVYLRLRTLWQVQYVQRPALLEQPCESGHILLSSPGPAAAALRLGLGRVVPPAVLADVPLAAGRPLRALEHDAGHDERSRLDRFDRIEGVGGAIDEHLLNAREASIVIYLTGKNDSEGSSPLSGQVETYRIIRTVY